MKISLFKSRLEKYFITRKKGIKTFDYRKGLGFYISIGLISDNPKGKNYEFKFIFWKL